MNLYSSQGSRLTLGQLVGKGAEGSVYRVNGQPSLLAKIYHSAPDALRHSKLHHMVKPANSNLSKIAAWPVDVVFRSPNKDLCGFLMPYIIGFEPVHRLYVPIDRKHVFPKAHWNFLVRVAKNAAIAFDTVHQAGHVIGDVNENSVLVNQAAIVNLIDCDSFQIQSGTNLYPCLVGVPLYTAPELFKVPSGSPRTANHDAFSLAVLVFHLLMMGRHPFAGVFSGKGDMPIEKAIPNLLYAYSETGRQSLMRPPPNSVPASFLPDKVKGFFEDAFSQAGISGKRPTAGMWSSALDELEATLIKCKQDSAHFYPRTANKCPWCEAIGTSGISYFIAQATNLFTNALGRGVSFESVLNRLRSLPKPTLPQFTPPEQISCVGEPLGKDALEMSNSDFGKLIFRVLGTSLILYGMVTSPKGFLFWAGLMWFLFACTKSRVGGRTQRLRKELALRQSKLDECESHFRELKERMRAHCGVQELIHQFAQLESIEHKYTTLRQWRSNQLQQLIDTAEERQLEEYLEGFLIRDHDIPGIGATRKSTLRSFNITSAADIKGRAILAIDGFGSGLTNKLIGWRNRIKASFRFDSTRTVTDADIKQLDVNVQRRRDEAIRELSNVAHLIEIGFQRYRAKSAEVTSTLNKMAAIVAQARADVLVVEQALAG